MPNYDFDEAAFNATKELMKDRFGILAEKYTRNAARYVQEVEQGILDEDAEKIIQGAHALKSSSAMLGFRGFQRCAVEIEAKARQGEIDLHEDIASLKNHLQHSLEVLGPYLE